MIGKGPAREEIWQIDYCGPASESLREDVLRPEARIGMLFGAQDTRHSPGYQRSGWATFLQLRKFGVSQSEDILWNFHTVLNIITEKIVEI